MDLYAPVLNLEEFGSKNMLSALKAEGEHIIHLQGRTFEFDIRFSENEDFNAAAYEVGNKAYINVSITTVMQLYHHVLLLMGREELLPEGGQEEAFEGKYRIEEFETPQICQYDKEFKQIAFYAGPDNPKRRNIAELITIFGMEFIIFHELGHHVGGHLRFLSENLGLQVLYAHGNGVALNPQVYQMLETDADAVAIATLLESISTKIDFYRDRFLDGVGKLIPHCVMIAITTAFFLMEREGGAYNINNARYLPRDVRFRLVVYIFMDKLSKDYKMCRFSQNEKQLTETFKICNTLLGELYAGKDPERKILFQESDDVRRYYNEVLVPLWKNIRNELNPYAVIHLPE